MFDKSATLALGSDQGGFELKEFLKIKLAEAGYSVRDFGSYTPESIDYPDVAHPVAKAVNEGRSPMAVLVCGSGNGVCMTANKYANVRAALCWSVDIAKLARQHNNANILCLPGRFIEKQTALNAAIAFLTTGFEGGRHEVRVEKIPIK